MAQKLMPKHYKQVKHIEINKTVGTLNDKELHAGVEITSSYLMEIKTSANETCFKE